MTRKDLSQTVAKTGFNKLLGLQLTKLHKDGITIEVKVTPDLLNGANMLHGGVTATLADVAIGVAIMRHFKGERRIVTVELKVTYFRPIQTGKVTARARLRRTGNHLCIGQVDITDADKNLAAIATATYMLI